LAIQNPSIRSSLLTHCLHSAVSALALLPVLAGCHARIKTIPPVALDTSFLPDYAATRGYSCGQPTNIELTPNGDTVLFLRSGPRDVIRDLYEISTSNGEVKILARADDLLGGSEEVLSPEEKARRERRRESGQGLVWYRLSEDGKLVLTGLGGKLYVIDRASGKVTTLDENPKGPPMDARFSPDGRFVSCVRAHDLYVTELATNQESRLTWDGTEDVAHGLAEFVAQEEMDRDSGYWWSGDSQWVAYEEYDQSEVEKLYIADARNPDQPPQGWRYPRAGKTNASVRLGIVSVTGGDTKWIDWDHTKYSYLATVRWGTDAPLTMYVMSRDQREGLLMMVDPATGQTTNLAAEKDAAWLDIDPGGPRWLPGGEEFLWISQRSGQFELELHKKEGSLIRSLRPGSAQLYGLVAVDGARREVVVSGSSDPTQSQLFRMSLDGGELVSLTREVGSHSGRFSKDCNTWVHTASLLDGTVIHAVRGRDATLRGELPSKAQAPPFIPKVELTTVMIEDRTYHASILRPRNFISGQKYPVLDYAYGGPGSNMVSATSRGQIRQQWMADQGFIIVSIDARGTQRHGREWSRATARNLIDIPINDHAQVLAGLAARYPEMDVSRLGVYGWSFGGYFSTMAVLKRPDVFHAAIAGAPVIDWADYDTCYTERYMGLPKDNSEGYKNCSALTFAKDLNRPLLLIHGTTDDNVYFMHTLKMSEALFKAGRPFELLALAGFTHMVPDPNVTVRLNERMAAFFKKHLVDATAATIEK
jgi:dipeptidyl-peptidase-4